MLLTIKDLSEHLQIKRSTLYLWAKQGRIPCLKLNGLVRFDPDAIAEWVKSSWVKSSVLLPDRLGKHVPGELEVIIARAKRAVYTPVHGETRPKPSPNGKEGE